MVSQKALILALVGLSLAMLVASEDSQATEADNKVNKEGEKVEVDEEKLTYAKGSLCGYCDYCKFCKLCDEDCPCESGPKRPNCHLCKYCKYCYLCKVCDSVCQPGGFLDRVTASIVNSLPSYNKEEVDEDIQKAKTWIDKTEL